MEWAAVAIALAAAGREKFRFGFFGLRESYVSCDGDVSVEFGVKPLDASKHELGDLDRRKLAFAKKFSDFLDGCEGQIGVVHGGHIKSQANMPGLNSAPRSP